MSYIIYKPKQVAINRLKQLTIDGVKAGFFPQGELYDFGGLLIVHPTEDKAAIQIYKFFGLNNQLSQNDILPCNYEPLFAADELAYTVNILPEDWSNSYQSTF